MDCEKFDFIMMGIVIILLAIVVAMAVFIMPNVLILLGIAVQCATEDRLGRFVAFVAAVVAASWMGYKAVDVFVNCRCRGEEDG